ncbi:hypothetical protein ACP6D5_33915, partial [Klebsiella pneumoniae subsp. pneumoniae]
RNRSRGLGDVYKRQQRDMQRREEVNINHSHRHDEQDDVEIGGNF